MDKCENLGTPEQRNAFYALFDKYTTAKDTIECLHDVGEIYGFIPEQTIAIMAEKLHTSTNEIFAIITFYNNFTTTPRAKYNIDVCLGTACHVLGGQEILDRVLQKLHLSVGQLSNDGRYLVSACRCLGCCGLAPVVSINGKIQSHCSVDNIDDILDNLE